MDVTVKLTITPSWLILTYKRSTVLSCWMSQQRKSVRAGAPRESHRWLI